MSAALILSFMVQPSVYASQFVEPEKISNREKAHLDVGFTGSAAGCLAIEAGTLVSAGTGGDGTDVDKSFTLGTDAKERRVNLMQALIDAYGLTPEQAAGPIGNFMRESGGEQLPPNINEGGRAGPPAFSGGYGWAQWTASRQVTFIDFAVKNGFMASKSVEATDAANLAYLKSELNSGYKNTITELKKQTTPEKAAISFEATFEKAGVPAISSRTEGARQAFTEYSGSGGDGGTGTSSFESAAQTNCVEGGATGESVASANFGEVVFPLKGSKKVVKNPGMFHDGDTDTGGHPYTAYDILANPGVEVVAFAQGEVTGTSVDRCGGKFLTIWNEEAKLGVTYMHLSDHIGKGTVVNPGEHVGTVGPPSAGCGTPHLHIDVATDKVRQGCSRLGCSILDHFRSIGKELFSAFEALPDN